MAKRHPTPKTLGTTDPDVIRIVDTFKDFKEYPTHSEAMEKLLMRAERLNLHRIDDTAFEAMVDSVLDSVPK